MWALILLILVVIFATLNEWSNNGTEPFYGNWRSGRYGGRYSNIWRGWFGRYGGYGGYGGYGPYERYGRGRYSRGRYRRGYYPYYNRYSYLPYAY